MNYVKYLGVLIDSTLSWKPHVTELSKKLSRNCAIFFKIRHYVNPETLRLLYYSLFYSFLSYGVSVWGLTHPTILDPIVKLQKQVVRAITFQGKHAHSSPLFFQLKTLKLFDIHSLHLLCFVYDCIKGQSLACFGETFTPLQSISHVKYPKGTFLWKELTLLSMGRGQLGMQEQCSGIRYQSV